MTVRGPAATRIIAVLVATALAGGAAGCGDDGGGRTPYALPDLSLPPLDGDGRALDVRELDGPAVVNLWATWCEPCKRELPDFQEVSERRPDVRFVGIDIGEDPGRALDFLATLDVDFEQYADPSGELTDALGVASLPVTLLVDGAGQVAIEHIGPMSVDELDDAIDDVTG